MAPVDPAKRRSEREEEASSPEADPEHDDHPLERDDLTLPDGRRLLIYRRRRPAG